MRQRLATCSLNLLLSFHTVWLHFPASLVIECGHMTEFQPIEWGGSYVAHKVSRLSHREPWRGLPRAWPRSLQIFFLRGQTVNILGLGHTDPVTTPRCCCYRPKAAMNNIQRNGHGYSPIKLYLQKWEAGSQFIVFDPCSRGRQSHKMEGTWAPEWLPGEPSFPPMRALALIQQDRNLRRHYTEFSGRGKRSLNIHCSHCLLFYVKHFDASVTLVSPILYSPVTV